MPTPFLLSRKSLGILNLPLGLVMCVVPLIVLFLETPSWSTRKRGAASGVRFGDDEGDEAMKRSDEDDEFL